MSIDATEIIRGQQYRLMKLDPLQAGRLATRVAQQLAGAMDDAEAIRSLIDGYQAQKASTEGAEGEQKDGPLALIMDTPKLLSALAGGIGKIDADGLYDCALECIKGRLFTDRKLHDDTALNAWFADRPDHLMLVLAWALKVNCAGFFGFGVKG